MYFSKNMKFLRKLRGFSQEYIAEILDYKSFTTIQKWEDGSSEPSVAVLHKLATLFGTTVDELYGQDIENEQEISTIAAHHDGENWTSEELDEIERFKEYVLSKRKGDAQ